jgi:hypothetical protein
MSAASSRAAVSASSGLGASITAIAVSFAGKALS